MTAEAERAAGRPTGPGRPPEPGHDEKIIQATLRLIDQDKPVTVNAEGDLPAKAVADLFPAYDDDGGLLLVLTPSR